MHTRRTYVFTLEGEKLAELDALGPLAEFAFAPSGDAIWVFERGGMFRRFSLA